MSYMKWIAVLGMTLAVMTASGEAMAREDGSRLAVVHGSPAPIPAGEPTLVLIVALEDIEKLDAAFPEASAPGEMAIVTQDDDIAEVQQRALPSKAEVIRMELIFQALNALDWATTKHCLDKGTCVEGNPIFGENPDMTKAALMKLAGGGLHALYTVILWHVRPEWLRPYQYGTVGFYAGVVAWNLQFAF